MEKCNEIKMEYGRLRQEIQNVLAGKLSDEELLRYFMATALKIWSGNVLYAPAYSELLSAVSGQSYTIEQIMSALGCCGEPERKLRVPQFFQELVALDAESGSSHASNVLRMLNDLLVAAALINGDFTIEEASCLSSMTQDLAQYAARARRGRAGAAEYGCTGDRAKRGELSSKRRAGTGSGKDDDTAGSGIFRLSLSRRGQHSGEYYHPCGREGGRRSDADGGEH